jgi:hypothetical protein
MAIVSAILLVRPRLLAAPLELPVGDGLWVRVAGMLTGFLAFYYWQAARAEITAFIRWTIIGRLTVMLVLFGFVLAGLAGTRLLLVGVVDVVAALWTWRSLRLDASAQSAVAME